MSAAALCDRSTLTVDGNVKIVWIKYRYLNCTNIHDVLCFFPETHPRNLDIRQHADNTNNIANPPSSSGPPHERVAGPLWLVVLSEAAIRRQSSPLLSFAVLCMYSSGYGLREII